MTCSTMRSYIILAFISTVTFVTIATVTVSEPGIGDTEGPGDSRYMYYWHPGDTRVLDLYLENQSPITDTLVIEATVSDPNWTFSMNQSRFEDVPPWTTVYFSFSLTAPMNAVEGGRVEVTITARSLATNVTDTMQWIAFMIVERDIAMLHPGEDYFELDDPYGITSEVRVNNTGDLPVNVTLESSSTADGDSLPDWVHVTLDPDRLELPRGEGMNVSVMIEMTPPTPLRSDVEYRTYIMARVLEDPSVTSTVRIEWGVAETFEATVESGSSSHRLPPHGEMTLYFSLFQTTNNHTGHTWRLLARNVSSGWEVRLPEGSYNVSGSGSFTETLTVAAPRTVLPGTYRVVELQFRCDQRPDIVLSSHISIEIEKTHFVQYSASPSYRRYTVEDMFNGTPARYDVTMYNRGNVQEHIGIDILTDGSRGTDSLTLKNPREAGVLVQPYSEYTFSFEVGVDGLTPAKEYWISVNFAWDHVPIPSARVYLEVDPYMDMQFEMEISPHTIVNPNLPEPRVTLTMENVGNMRVPYYLQWSVLPVDGVVHLRGEYQRMSDLHMVQSGESRNHTFILFMHRPEPGLPMDGGSFQLTAYHYDGHSLWNNSVEYSIVLPDLHVQGIEFGAMVRRGIGDVLTVTVVNRGDGWSSETVMVLTSESTREELSRAKVPMLAPGGSVSIPMNFTLGVSLDYFIINVDPDNDVHEVSDGDNSRRHIVRDTVIPPGRDSVAFSFLKGFSVMLALTIIVFGSYYLWKRRA